MNNSARTLLWLVSSLCFVIALRWWTQSGPSSHASRPFNSATSTSPSRIVDGIDPSALRIKTWHTLQDFPQEVAQFETVFWEPQDTTSLRAYLAADPALHRARILEIGTGTGLISLYCAQRGAASVVATDINPQAVANARYNAELFGLTNIITVRLVSFEQPAPFAVIDPAERFDLIISNPPWEDAQVDEVAAAALYDPDFALLDGLLEQGAQHLQPGGKLLVAYGAKRAIERILTRGPACGWRVTLRDDRSLAELPEVFLPGMLLELNPF